MYKNPEVAKKQKPIKSTSKREIPRAGALPQAAKPLWLLGAAQQSQGSEKPEQIQQMAEQQQQHRGK